MRAAIKFQNTCIASQKISSTIEPKRKSSCNENTHVNRALKGPVLKNRWLIMVTENTIGLTIKDGASKHRLKYYCTVYDNAGKADLSMGY